VLVVGCGVYEAVATAAQEPLLDVLGIDQSAVVVNVARDMAEKAGVENVKFIHDDFLNLSPYYSKFDLICANGVLHHIPGGRLSDRFVARAAALLVPGGLFEVMVYGDQYRSFVPDFCHALRLLGVQRDQYGIALVRALIDGLPEHHPVKAFYTNVADYDAQIADLWLHPYFRQYGAHELLALVECHGLKFQRWLNPAIDFSLIDGFPGFDRLSFREKCRVAQIVNHADMKLAAVFAK
jgi:SAM-dependent methyltransferase